jgi:hypothetical protein
MPAVRRMMQLIQHHEGVSTGAASLEDPGGKSHLLIRDDRAVIVRRLTRLLVRQSGIQM